MTSLLLSTAVLIAALPNEWPLPVPSSVQPVHSIAYSEKLDLSVSWSDKTLRIIDVSDGQLIDRREFSVSIVSACFIENGERLALLGSDGILRIEASRTGRLIDEIALTDMSQVPETTTISFPSVAASNEAGAILADLGSGVAWVLDFDGKQLGEFPSAPAYYESTQPIFALDGKFALSFNGKEIWVNNIPNPQLSHKYTCCGRVLSAAVDQERNLVATGHTGGGIICWSLTESGTLKEKWKFLHDDILQGRVGLDDDWDRYPFLYPRICSLAFNHGALFYCRSTINDVGVIDLKTGERTGLYRPAGGNPGQKLLLLPDCAAGLNWFYRPRAGRLGLIRFNGAKLMRQDVAKCDAACKHGGPRIISLKLDTLFIHDSSDPPVIVSKTAITSEADDAK